MKRKQRAPGGAPTRVILWGAGLLLAAAAWSGEPPAASSPEPDFGTVLERREFIESVLRRNPGVVAATRAWEAARWRVPQAGSLDDPRASYAVAPSSLAAGTRIGNQVGLSQRFPFPGTLRLRTDVAEALAAASGEKPAEVRLRLATLASLLYDRYWTVARGLEINAQHERLLEELKRVATGRYAAGLAPQQAPLQAEVEAAHLLHRHATLETERRTIVAQLDALLHRAAGAPLPPPTSELVLPSVPAGTGAELQTEALETRPEVLAQRAQIDGLRAARTLQTMDRKLAQFPEVASVFGKMGRARTATDPAPIGMVESTVMLKPRSEWRPGLTWEGLIAEMDAALAFPGMPNIWWMPIQTRTEMLSTGIRSPLGIKIFGDDLESIEKAAVAIEKVVGEVPGTRSAFADRPTGGFYFDVAVNRRAAARYGLTVHAVNEVVRTAIGGMRIAETVEGRERYPISVRYARDFREDPESLERVLLTTPTGAEVPLRDVARLSFATGPPAVRSEDGRLVGYVFVDPGDRAIADYVRQAREVVAEKVDLPTGVRLEWAGQFTYFERAKEKLEVVLPLTLAVIVVLLYLNTRSLAQVGIILAAVPFSLVGAVWLLWLLGYHISVAVWVGVIALAGVDAETGVVMLLYLQLAFRRRQSEGRLYDFADLREAIVEGAAQRIRPKLMTALVLLLGLMPLMWSSGTGADVMRRIAAPMIGGIVTSFALQLTVYPAIFAVWKRRAPGAPGFLSPPVGV